MKKLLIGFTMMLVLCTIILLNGRNNYLSYSEYEKLISENENFYLVIGKKDCSDCIEFDKYMKSEKGIYKVDVSNKKDLEDWSDFIKINKIKYVPSMYQIKKGKSTKIQGEGNAKELYNNYKKDAN